MSHTPSVPDISIDFRDQEVKTSELEKLERRKQMARDIQFILAAFYGGQKGERIEKCGDFLVFRNWLNPEKTKKLIRANFCKHALCPICAWRKHLLTSKIVSQALKLAAERHGKLFHLVLTVQNVDKLDRENLMELKSRAVRLIKKQMGFPDYLVSLEITNQGSGFHPHVHCLIYTENRFRKIKISEVKKEWGAANGEEWLMCFCREIDDEESAAAEIGKYVSKIDCPAGKFEDVIKEIAAATYGVRRISAAGVLNECMKEAKLFLSVERVSEKISLEPYMFYDEFCSWVENTYIVR